MKLPFLAALFAALLVACNPAPTPAPSPAPEAAAPIAAHDALIGRRAHRASPRFALAGEGDNRTPAEIAIAACSTPTGWACPSIARPFKASAAQPAIPPSWTVPTWDADPANKTGCASDSNSCTSATCGTTGIGPCLTITEITSHRWGTSEPILAQSTTINLLSSQAVQSEDDVLEPIVVGPHGSTSGSVFGIVGTPSAVTGTPTVLGTVTAKNRASNTLLSANMGSVTNLAVGQLVVNTTRANSWALVETISGNVVTFTQPLQAFTIANANLFPTPAEVDTWATGDAITVETVPTINLKLLQPRGGDGDSSFTTGLTWVQNVNVPDVTGSPGNATFAPQSQDEAIIFVGSQINPYASTGPGPGSFDSVYWIGCAMNGGSNSNYATILAGYGHGFAWTMFGFADVDLDTIFRDGLEAVGTPNNIGYAYIAQASVGLLVYNDAQLAINDDLNGTPGAALYGNGNISVRAGGQLLQTSGGTWATRVYMSGTWSMGLSGATTGTMYDAGVWIDGVPISAANLDLHAGGLQNPRTGARYSNAE